MCALYGKTFRVSSLVFHEFSQRPNPFFAPSSCMSLVPLAGGAAGLESFTGMLHFFWKIEIHPSLLYPLERDDKKNICKKALKLFCQENVKRNDEK